MKINLLLFRYLTFRNQWNCLILINQDKEMRLRRHTVCDDLSEFSDSLKFTIVDLLKNLQFLFSWGRKNKKLDENNKSIYIHIYYFY